MKNNHQELSFRQALRPLLFIVFIFFFNIFSRSILSPLLLEVESEFSLSHTKASQFFLYISFGNSLMMFFSGFVSARLMHKGTIVCSTLLIAVGLGLMAAAPYVWLLQISLVFLGLGAGLYAPSGISSITGMVRKGDWQKALSLHELGPHIAMAAVPLFAAFLLPFVSWRGVVLAAAAGAAAAGLFFQFFVNVGKSYGEPPTFGNIIPLLRLPAFWILMLFLSLALGSIQGIYLLIPTFMVAEAGFSQTFTNTVFGISRFVPAAALLTAGLMLDRIGIRRTIFWNMIISGAAIALLGLLHGNWLIAVIFLQPAVGALFLPAGMAALSAIGPARSRNVAVSMVLPIASFVGNGGIPAFVGFMGDAVSFSAGFMIIGTLMVLLAGLTRFIRLNTDDEAAAHSELAEKGTAELT